MYSVVLDNVFTVVIHTSVEFLMIGTMAVFIKSVGKCPCCIKVLNNRDKIHE